MFFSSCEILKNEKKGQPVDIAYGNGVPLTIGDDRFCFAFERVQKNDEDDGSGDLEFGVPVVLRLERKESSSPDKSVRRQRKRVV